VRILLLACLCASLPAFAGFSGTLKSSTDIYPQRLGEPTDEIAPYLIMDFNGKQRVTKKLRYQWRAYGLTNPESEHSPEKLYGDVPEAFFEWKPSALRVRFGLNTINWGVTDLASPSDVVNPSAFFHPLRTIKRGSPMIELDYNKEVIGVHAVYIPRQRRGLLPSEDSRWLPRSFLVNVDPRYGRVIIPPFLEYDFDGDEVLESGSNKNVLTTNALDHNAGLRLNSHLGRLDLFAMHFEGAAPQPKVRPTIVLVASGNDFEAVSPVKLTPVYYRVRTSSLGMVWALDKLIVRAESAYQHTISEDPLLQPWSWANVLALETNVNVGATSMILLSQFYYTVNPQAPDNMISSSYRLFDRTGVFGMRWPFSEKITFTGSLLYEANTKGMFWMASFEQKLSDSLRFGLGWRDFSAQEDGLIKTFERNDHATVDLTYFF